VLLALDIGNTETTAGLFEGGHLLRTARWPAGGAEGPEDLERALLAAFPEAGRVAPGGGAGGGAGAPGTAPGGITAAAIASVVPAETPRYARAARRLTGTAPLEISASLKTGLEVEYRDPGSLGADRLANAVAGAELYGVPVIVVDLGTATKFEVVAAGRR
jgi:type III pantothenate kinase